MQSADLERCKARPGEHDGVEIGSRTPVNWGGRGRADRLPNGKPTSQTGSPRFTSNTRSTTPSMGRISGRAGDFAIQR